MKAKDVKPIHLRTQRPWLWPWPWPWWSKHKPCCATTSVMALLCYFLLNFLQKTINHFIMRRTSSREIRWHANITAIHIRQTQTVMTATLHLKLD